MHLTSAIALVAAGTLTTPLPDQTTLRPVIALVGQIQPCSGQDVSASYAPVHVPCPTDIQWIRPATGLAPVEADWVYGRKKVVTEALEGYLLRLQLEDFNVCEYIGRLHASNYSLVPTMGLAISGGGVNSAFTGTGALRAFDARLDAAVQQGTGGLLQSMTYMSGLSGGSWPTMSFAVHNFPTADEIEAGFNASVADYFGRAWGYEYIAGSPGGINGTFSGVANLSNFVQHQMPLPIILLNEMADDAVEYFGVQIPFANATTVSNAERCLYLLLRACNSMK